MKRRNGRIISILLGFCMLLSMIPSTGLTAFAETATPPTDTWDNHAADSFAGGTGTQEDPYQIATAEQFAKLANDVNNKDGSGTISYINTYFVLTADIDLSAYRWNPIGIYQSGISNTRFSGCLDGKNHTISGLYVDERDSGLSAGLFGSIGVAGVSSSDTDIMAPTVKNLTIDNAEIYASDKLPSEYSRNGFAGILTGYTTNYYSKSIIENVHVSGKINTESVSGRGIYCGGMIGNCYNLLATNCSADVIIDGGISRTSGGFIGFAVGGKFENCTAKGSMRGRFSLGGFVGEAQKLTPSTTDADPIINSEFNKCVSYLDITATGSYVGGFVGYLSKGTISNCASYGNVTSEITNSAPMIGGFAGTNADTIQYSHTTSTVTESHQDFVAGGFVGNDNNGKTIACSFDNTKNADLDAIGGIQTEGTNDIAGAPTATVLANICRDVFGKHSLTHYQAADANCKEAGNVEYWHCSACGMNFSDENGTTEIADVSTPATGHSYVHHDAVTAECEKSGMEEYYTCENCDLIFDKDKNETTAEALTINETGHTFSTEWKTDSQKHWHECSCGAKAEEAAHTFEWITDKEAKVGVAGSKHEECTQCGYAKAAVKIPALKSTKYPPVIDDTDGGKITVNPKKPQAGDEVTITVKPKNGKVVDKIVVTDAKGNEISVTDNGDGTYTFTQPDSEVTIKATFKAEQSSPSTDEKSPQTGDESNMILLLTLLCSSALLLAGSRIIVKKKQRSR